MNKVDLYKFNSFEIKKILLENLKIQEKPSTQVKILATVGRKRIVESALHEVVVEVEEVTK